MRQAFLAALAAAAMAAGGLPGDRAEATMLAAPWAAGGAAAVPAQKAAVVCGYRGCVRVWPRHYYGYRPWTPAWATYGVWGGW